MASKSSKPRLALAHASPISVVKDRVPLVFTLRDLKIFEQHDLRPRNVFLDPLILALKDPEFVDYLGNTPQQSGYNLKIDLCKACEENFFFVYSLGIHGNRIEAEY